jgi:hypothetical protein
MGLFEDLQSRLDAVTARLAAMEARLQRAENTAGVSRDEAAQFLGINVRTLDGYVAPTSPYFDADLAACAYFVKGRRLFHPHRLEAYRDERTGKGRADRGRKSRVHEGGDARGDGPEPSPGDRAA